MKIAVEENKNSTNISVALQSYKTLSTTNKSPCELLMNRALLAP